MNNTFFNNGINIETDKVSDLITSQNYYPTDSPIIQIVSHTKNGGKNEKNKEDMSFLVLLVPMLLVGIIVLIKHRY